MHSPGVSCARRADLTGFSCLATYALEKVVALLPCSGALAAGSFYYSTGTLQASQTNQWQLH